MGLRCRMKFGKGAASLRPPNPPQWIGPEPPTEICGELMNISYIFLVYKVSFSVKNNK